MVFTISTATWGWPQWTYIALAVLALCTHAMHHGEPRKPYNIGWGLADFATAMVLLIAGGFFA